VHGESDLKLLVVCGLVFKGIMKVESRRNKRRHRIWIAQAFVLWIF
jgi:hypothetical protein